MKKISPLNLVPTLTLLTALLPCLLTSQANAKTEGNYLGIDLIRRSNQVNSNSNLASDQADLSEYYDHKGDDSAYGVGINYKYAFNFNNFFVAPGISYYLANNDVKAGYSTNNYDPYSQSMKLKSQANFQTNFGYDINDQFAAYIPLGVSIFEYELKTSDADGPSSPVTSKKSARKSAFFGGLGLSYAPVTNWVVNLEYNKFQEFEITSSTEATVSGGQITAKNNVDMLKLGIAYKF